MTPPSSESMDAQPVTANALVTEAHDALEHQQTVFGTRRPVIGVLELFPFPPVAGFEKDWVHWQQRIEQDALAWASCGVDGVLLSCYGLTPQPQHYHAAALTPWQGACLVNLIQHLKSLIHLPLGLGCLPEDAAFALAAYRQDWVQWLRLPLLFGSRTYPNGVLVGAWEVWQGLYHQYMAPKPSKPWPLMVTDLPEALTGLPCGETQPDWVAALDSVKTLNTAWVTSWQQNNPGQGVNMADCWAQGWLHWMSVLPPCDRASETKLFQSVAERFQHAHGLLLAHAVYKPSSLVRAEIPKSLDTVKVQKLLRALQPYRYDSARELDVDQLPAETFLDPAKR